MHLNLSILTIGSELLDGRVLDTNSQVIAERANSLGIVCKTFLSCDDVHEEIISALEFLSHTSDIIIVTGGLGPTTDDLTTEAISAFVKEPCELRPAILDWIKSEFQKRRRDFDKSNEKQAFFPKGATVIPNPVGTAPGFHLQTNFAGKTKTIVSLPGVPSELIPMLSDTVVPLLKSICGENTALIDSRLIRLFGLAEATVGTRIKALQLSKEIFVSYRATYPYIDVKLKCLSGKEDLDNSINIVGNQVGKEFIIANTDEATLESVVHELLIREKLTIGTAESCTGGLIASLLTNQPGSSAYFMGSIISYANEIKESLLSVPREMLNSVGAVSPQVAGFMAKSARDTLSTSLAVSVTGIAGPDGGSDEKPVGTVYMGVASKAGVQVYRIFIKGNRKRVRFGTAHYALDSIRRLLSKLSPSPDLVLCES